MNPAADAERHSPHGPRMDRRQFLALTAAQTAFAGCTVAPSKQGSTTDWETAADRRIRRHRTSPLAVRVSDASGAAVDGASVHVEMRSHRFGFGTAVDAKRLVEGRPGGPYRRHLAELFNKAVLENRHKWAFWETPADRRYAIRATNWLLDRDFEMRGHACVWQKFDQGAIPRDVERAVSEGDGSHVARRAREHVDAIVGHYAGRSGFTEWDVANEPTVFHALTDVVGDEEGPLAPELVTWYERARRADDGAQLFVNEYNILPGTDDGHRDTYERIVEFLLRNGAPLGGIGLQAHHSSVADRRSSEQLLATLDRFASFGVPLQVSEYDNWGPRWTDRTEAEYFHRFLKTAFSHPAVEGFLMWGFWNGAHWKGNAPLFREDWSKKPAYDRYVNLVLDEWWTDERGTTGANGRYRTSAFLGDYRLTASKDGRSQTVRASVIDPSTPTAVELTLGSET